MAEESRNESFFQSIMAYDASTAFHPFFQDAGLR